MARVIVGMTSSLDGFVADQSGRPARLYPDLAALRGTTYMNAAIEETGSVLMGRRTFEMGHPDSYVGNYEFQVPIVVLTHHPPGVSPKQDNRLTFTFVTDGIKSAVAQATAAAGDRAVTVVGGPNVVQQLLHAGQADELRQLLRDQLEAYRGYTYAELAVLEAIRVRAFTTFVAAGFLTLVFTLAALRLYVGRRVAQSVRRCPSHDVAKRIGESLTLARRSLGRLRRCALGVRIRHLPHHLGDRMVPSLGCGAGPRCVRDTVALGLRCRRSRHVCHRGTSGSGARDVVESARAAALRLHACMQWLGAPRSSISG